MVTGAMMRFALKKNWDEIRLTSLVGAWQGGAMSKETLYENLQQGEIANPDRTFKEEQSLIDNADMGLNGDGE